MGTEKIVGNFITQYHNSEKTDACGKATRTRKLLLCVQILEVSNTHGRSITLKYRTFSK